MFDLCQGQQEKKWDYYYGYYFTQYTQFEKIGNTVYFKNGKGKYVYCTNGGCNVSELRDSFTIPNWHNIQSNIYEVDFPAVTSLDKNYVHIIDFASQIISAFVSVVVLCFIAHLSVFNIVKRLWYVLCWPIFDFNLYLLAKFGR